MAHKLEKHYSDFGGLDTRSNLLTQNSKSARLGSKNFRWNYKDQLQQREGFQHKTDEGSACEFGLIEYKFKDIDTGKSKAETLGVGSDGQLRRERFHRLKLTRTTLSSVAYYNLIYDDVNTTHKIDFLDSSLVSLGSVNISLTQTLDQLKTAINALALTGLTADIVDEEGSSVTSSVKAYLLDVTYHKEFVTTLTDIVYNSAGYWELIETPDGNAPFTNVVAYVAKTSPFDNPEVYESFEGISYVNENNSVYITDGGFPFKYDGKAVYRAGMPKTPESDYSDTGYNGIAYTFNTNPGWNSGAHYLRLGIKYKDRNGVTTIGKVQPYTRSYVGSGGQGYGSQLVSATNTDASLGISVKEIINEDQFPIYSCMLNGAQSITSTAGSKVLTVDSGHNVKVGMALRIDYTPILTSYWVVSSSTKVIYLEVTAVTATTITVNLAQNLSSDLDMSDNQVLNACYVPEILFTKSGDLANTSFSGFDWYGAYYVLYATKSDVNYDGTYYEVGAFPIPATSAMQYSVHCETLDAGMVVQLQEEGEDLPRACKYLNKWQETLIQAGRPYDSATIAAQFYPTVYGGPHTNGVKGTQSTADYNFDRYTEVHLCDYQSVYWADSVNSNFEGFPQSGLNEESFETDFNDEITGIGTNKEALFALKDRTTGYITGTLADGDLVKEILEAEIGNVCQAAIQPVNGGIMYMDQDGGFYSVVAGRLPVFLGFPIQDYFKKNNQKLTSEKLNFKKAKSANFKAQNQYICYIPAGKETDPSSSSLFLVYDYSEVGSSGIRGCWYVWQDVNAAGGVLATASGDLLISQKQTSNNRLWKQKFTGSKYDFSDHTSGIEFNYKPAFSTASAPVIDKAWIRCVINSVLGGFSLRVDQYANFLDTVVASMSITFADSATTSRKTVKDEVKANTDKLSGISFGFYNNTIHEAVTIDGWEVELSPSFDLGEAKR